MPLYLTTFFSTVDGEDLSGITVAAELYRGKTFVTTL